MSLYKNNTTGRVGVVRCANGKFEGKIGVNYSTIHLGTRDTIEEASVARAAAERKFDFHERHGEPAPPSLHPKALQRIRHRLPTAVIAGVLYVKDAAGRVALAEPTKKRGARR